MNKQPTIGKDRKPEVDTVPTQESKIDDQQKKQEGQTVTELDIKAQTISTKPFNQTSMNFIPKHIAPYFQRSLGKTTYLFRIRSPSPTRPIVPTTRRTNGIPLTLLERIKLMITIFNDEEFIAYYKATPQRISSSLEKITDHITSYTGPHGELSIFAMIFYYISHQITYCKKGLNQNQVDNDQKPENVLKQGMALSNGFCNLFEHFCKPLKLRYKRINGHCKYFGFKIGTDCSVNNHSWHGIRVRNEWYFCDVTFSSGGNQEKNKFVATYFNPYYFMTPPEYLIDSHRPEDDDWQMNPKTVTLKQFSLRSNLHLAEFYQKVYEKDMTLVSHEFPVIHSPDLTSLVIQLIIPQTVLLANLYYANVKAKICELKYSYDDKTNLFFLEPVFPAKGEYIISISGRSVISTDLIYHHLINYKIKVGETYAFKRPHLLLKKYKETKRRETLINNTAVPSLRLHTNQGPRMLTDYNKFLLGKENKKICLDNTNAYLFEPRAVILKIGNETKFKVRIKGALAVFVLDGKKWSYLKKKDEDLYEGQVIIQGEQVSICSLKSCNVYTEVFQFKTNKT